MQLICIDEAPPVGFDWVADSRQISLASASAFHHPSVNTCNLLPALQKELRTIASPQKKLNKTVSVAECHELAYWIAE